MLSCRLTSGSLRLGIYLFLWWFLLVIFELFLLHWRYELPCQDKLPEFHSTPILGCIRILWLACLSSIRVGVRQSSLWLEFCHMCIDTILLQFHKTLKTQKPESREQALLFPTLVLLNAAMSQSSFHSCCMVFHPSVMDNPSPFASTTCQMMSLSAHLAS